LSSNASVLFTSPNQVETNPDSAEDFDNIFSDLQSLNTNTFDVEKSDHAMNAVRKSFGSPAGCDDDGGWLSQLPLEDEHGDLTTTKIEACSSTDLTTGLPTPENVTTGTASERDYKEFAEGDQDLDTTCGQSFHAPNDTQSLRGPLGGEYIPSQTSWPSLYLPYEHGGYLYSDDRSLDRVDEELFITGPKDDFIFQADTDASVPARIRELPEEHAPISVPDQEPTRRKQPKKPRKSEDALKEESDLNINMRQGIESFLADFPDKKKSKAKD